MYRFLRYSAVFFKVLVQTLQVFRAFFEGWHRFRFIAHSLISSKFHNIENKLIEIRISVQNRTRLPVFLKTTIPAVARCGQITVAHNSCTCGKSHIIASKPIISAGFQPSYEVRR